MNFPLETPPRPSVVLYDYAEPRIVGLESWSPPALKAHRALALAGIGYETRRLAHPVELAGQGVPVAELGGEIVYDRAQILTRIAKLAPGRFEPVTERDRAEASVMEDWAERALGGFVVASRWADPKNWPLYRNVLFGDASWFERTFVIPRIRRRVLEGLVARDVIRAGMEALWDDFLTTLDQLERLAPRAGFWGGQDRPSCADLAIFANIRSLRTHVTAWQSREIAKRPALVDWLDRVDDATRSRPKIRLVLEAA